MSITARVTSLEKWRAVKQPPRLVIIVATSPNWREHVPGSIDVGDKCVSMVVPSEYEHDPELGLTDEQRDFLRPDDKLVVVCYEEFSP
jgi:hypothetical protein